MTENLIENLRQSTLFENTPEVLLAKIAKITELQSIKSGEHLIVKGEMGTAMYIVRDGSVKVHDGDLLLNILKTGDVFGEMAALDGEVRTASITAVEDTKLIKLERDALYDLGKSEPELAKSIIHFLCQREKNIISDITERSFKLRALEREFEIGRNIQSGFLPESIPTVEGWDIAAYFKAAKEVAGDFYDIYEIGEKGHIGLAVGDVCGKGVGAALFMALFRSLLRASMLAGTFVTQNKEQNASFLVSEMKKNTEKMLINSVSLANNYVAHTHASACMFSTLFIAVLNPATGKVLYINAGHESPVIINSKGIKEKLPQTGAAVGIFPDTPFEVRETRLEKGDSLVAFTDGVVEAVNEQDEPFSYERLFDILMDCDSSSKEVLEKVVLNLNNFTGNKEQFDDITLLKIQRI